MEKKLITLTEDEFYKKFTPVNYPDTKVSELL